MCVCPHNMKVLDEMNNKKYVSNLSKFERGIRGQVMRSLKGFIFDTESLS